MDRWSGIFKVPLQQQPCNSNTKAAYYRVAISLCLSPSSTTNLITPSANVIFFNGDRVEGSGDPTIDRLSNIQTISELLVSKFGASINAYVIESSYYNGPFAVYKDFIPSSNSRGEPKLYNPIGFPASTSIASLLASSLHQAVKVNDFVEPSSTSSCPHTFLLGFSKGGTVLNQLVTELGNMDKQTLVNEVEEEGILVPNSRECFLNSISEIHYVDVGLNSSLAYLTDRKTIERISNRIIQMGRRGVGGSGIRFVIHGTPRQWCDGRREWIRAEKDELVRLLQLEARKTGGKLSVIERLYFADKLPSLKMHFEVIEHMDVSV
ncbi:mitochondrial protein C2orf69 homolog isoform X2 [Impatiens glandulifera]|nr:mitochondrial protein C2orf69 homolog isoform X2 [Impatiens glandulifera]